MADTLPGTIGIYKYRSTSTDGTDYILDPTFLGRPVTNRDRAARGFTILIFSMNFDRDETMYGPNESPSQRGSDEPESMDRFGHDDALSAESDCTPSNALSAYEQELEEFMQLGSTTLPIGGPAGAGNRAPLPQGLTQFDNSSEQQEVATGEMAPCAGAPTTVGACAQSADGVATGGIWGAPNASPEPAAAPLPSPRATIQTRADARDAHAPTRPNAGAPTSVGACTPADDEVNNVGIYSAADASPVPAAAPLLIPLATIQARAEAPNSRASLA